MIERRGFRRRGRSRGWRCRSSRDSFAGRSANSSRCSSSGQLWQDRLGRGYGRRLLSLDGRACVWFEFNGRTGGTNILGWRRLRRRPRFQLARIQRQPQRPQLLMQRLHAPAQVEHLSQQRTEQGAEPEVLEIGRQRRAEHSEQQGETNRRSFGGCLFFRLHTHRQLCRAASRRAHLDGARSEAQTAGVSGWCDAVPSASRAPPIPSGAATATCGARVFRWRHSSRPRTRPD